MIAFQNKVHGALRPFVEYKRWPCSGAFHLTSVPIPHKLEATVLSASPAQLVSAGSAQKKIRMTPMSSGHLTGCTGQRDKESPHKELTKENRCEN